MIHLDWHHAKIIKKVKCVQNKAKKYTVDKMLTEGKTYNVINETEEFVFVIDNSDRIAGYYKEYFEAV